MVEQAELCRVVAQPHRLTCKAACLVPSQALFDNGGVVYLLIGWWVIAKLRKSRSRSAPKSSTVQPNATKHLSTAQGLSKTTERPPAKPTSAGNAAAPVQ